MFLVVILHGKMNIIIKNKPNVLCNIEIQHYPIADLIEKVVIDSPIN